MLVLMNWISPSTYESLGLLGMISSGVYGSALSLILASLGKLLCMFVILVVGNQSILDTEFMWHTIVNMLTANWMPEFAEYVLPAVGTASYFLTFSQ